MKRKTVWWLGGLTAAGALAAALSRYLRKQRLEAWYTHMRRHYPLTALVTGASSGIGEAYARKLASFGYNLVLVARREARLHALATEFRQKYGVQAEVLPADLSTEAGIARVEQRIVGGDDIDFLINNAGYGLVGNFAETPIEQTQALLACHVLASLRLCRAALPGMIHRQRGAIVNVASVAAFVPKAQDGTYGALKAFLLSFSQSLALELAGTPIRVQALCPGFTRTGFHDHPEYIRRKVKQRIPAWLWMNSEPVVTASLRALGENEVVCVPGWHNRLIVAATRFGLTNWLLTSVYHFLSQR